MLMDTIKSLGELSLGSRLKRVSELCMKNIQLAYHHYNIDFDPFLFPAFHFIANNDRATTTELFEALQTSQPAITQTINKLTKKNLVVNTTDEIDKRKKLITLSEEGKVLHQQMRPIWRAMERAVKEFTNHKKGSLMEHIDHLETTVQSGAFLERIKEYANMELQTKIISFDPKYKSDFYDLNIEWLETYFQVEDFDKEVLSNPEKYILDPGGHIFYIVENQIVLGTVALMKESEFRYELTKMAVLPSARGRKLGQLLMQHCIGFAKENHIQLFLYSNRILENAIHIYLKYGFVEVPVEPNNPYKRSNIKMEIPL